MLCFTVYYLYFRNAHHPCCEDEAATLREGVEEMTTAFGLDPADVMSRDGRNRFHY